MDLLMLKRTLALAAMTAFAGAASIAGTAAADEVKVRALQTRSPELAAGRTSTSIGVTLDFARILTFDHPARTIVIGNPAIVDGTLSDEHTMVLTGKAIGTTNMIIFGDGGREIANLAVNVLTNNSQVTTVHHGVQQQIFSCSETCRPAQPIIAK